MTAAAQVEQEVGISRYATSGAPCQGRAKSFAEDFVVEEQLRSLDVSSSDSPGSLPLYRVEKRSIDTLHMVTEIASALKSRVSYAGLKDKKAFAVQYVTPTSSRSGRPEEVAGASFTAKRVGYVTKPLSRSALAGNRFHILLRDCCPEMGTRIAETLDLARARRLPNYYGLQRFGSSGAGTHLIGRALVHADFEGAVRTMLLSGPVAGEPGLAAKEAFAAGRYAEGAALLPRGRDVEKRVAAELGRRPGQWIRAMRALPVALRRLYVHAYQAAIFNRTISAALESGEDISQMKSGDNWAATSDDGIVVLAPRGVKDAPVPGAVPLVQVVGYAYRDYGSRFDRFVKSALEEERVKPGEFYVREMQEVSSEGGFRRPHLALGDASWGTAEGGVSLMFTLGKGQYATVFLREIIKPRDPVAAGLG